MKKGLPKREVTSIQDVHYFVAEHMDVEGASGGLVFRLARTLIEEVIEEFLTNPEMVAENCRMSYRRAPWNRVVLLYAVAKTYLRSPETLPSSERDLPRRLIRALRAFQAWKDKAWQHGKNVHDPKWGDRSLFWRADWTDICPSVGRVMLEERRINKSR